MHGCVHAVRRSVSAAQGLVYVSRPSLLVAQRCVSATQPVVHGALRKRACRSEAVIWMAGREDSTAMEDVAQGGWVRSERKPGRYAPMQNGLNARNHGFDLPAHRMYVVVGKSRKVGYDA